MEKDGDSHSQRDENSDYLLTEAAVTIKKYETIFGFLGTLARVVGFIICCYLITQGFISIAEQSSDQLSALARIADAASRAVSAAYTVPWALLCLSLMLNAIQRYRNRRAVKKLGEMRRQMEGCDPSRASSGLNQWGETP